MKKKLEIEVVGSVKDHVASLLFSFYKDEEAVGYVNIDNKGSLLWGILNEKYEKNILELASRINGKKINNTIEEQFQCFMENDSRWIRAIHAVQTLGLNIKAQSEEELEESEVDLRKSGGIRI